jgi:hypothetical protein
MNLAIFIIYIIKINTMGDAQERYEQDRLAAEKRYLQSQITRKQRVQKTVVQTKKNAPSNYSPGFPTKHPIKDRSEANNTLLSGDNVIRINTTEQRIVKELNTTNEFIAKTTSTIRKPPSLLKQKTVDIVQRKTAQDQTKMQVDQNLSVLSKTPNTLIEPVLISPLGGQGVALSPLGGQGVALSPMRKASIPKTQAELEAWLYPQIWASMSCDQLIKLFNQASNWGFTAKQGSDAVFNVANRKLYRIQLPMLKLTYDRCKELQNLVREYKPIELKQSNTEFKKDYAPIELDIKQAINALPEYQVEFQEKQNTDSIIEPIDDLSLVKSNITNTTSFENSDNKERPEIGASVNRKLINPLEKVEKDYGNVTVNNMNDNNNTNLLVNLGSSNTGPKINENTAISSAMDPFERDVVLPLKTDEAQLKAGNIADSRPDSFNTEITKPNNKRKATNDLARPKNEKKSKLPIVAGVSAVAAIAAAMVLI